MNVCRSCRAPIVWAETAGGKRMPVDAEPAPLGNIALTELDDGRVHASVVAEGAVLLTEQPLHLSHFATCPNADQHRSAR